MIEKLFPAEELHTVSPPKMQIGDFITFIGYNPLGKGQQAVHNSGSSMLQDTPQFKGKVLIFLNEHFKYEETSDDLMLVIERQVNLLNKFKSNLPYRLSVLNDIFNDKDSFSFKTDISSNHLYVALILFFVKEFNYFKSTHDDHDLTKNKASEYYTSEAEFLVNYMTVLTSDPHIPYLSDVCYGRYYFLEVHFSERVRPRQVPKQIVQEFLKIQDKHSEDFNLIEQEEVQAVEPVNPGDLAVMDNRDPELTNIKGKTTYKRNPRIAKTVLRNAGYRCEISQEHMTFYTIRGIHFSESHHLIPMAFQKDFLPINIDRSENIVSLCPICHRAVHLGNDSEKNDRLRILYDQHIDALRACGLGIEYVHLISFYISDVSSFTRKKSITRDYGTRESEAKAADVSPDYPELDE